MFNHEFYLTPATILLFYPVLSNLFPIIHLPHILKHVKDEFGLCLKTLSNALIENTWSDNMGLGHCEFYIVWTRSQLSVPKMWSVLDLNDNALYNFRCNISLLIHYMVLYQYDTLTTFGLNNFNPKHVINKLILFYIYWTVYFLISSHKCNPITQIKLRQNSS